MYKILVSTEISYQTDKGHIPLYCPGAAADNSLGSDGLFFF